MKGTLIVGNTCAHADSIEKEEEEMKTRIADGTLDGTSTTMAAGAAAIFNSDSRGHGACGGRSKVRQNCELKSRLRRVEAREIRWIL